MSHEYNKASYVISWHSYQEHWTDNAYIDPTFYEFSIAPFSWPPTSSITILWSLLYSPFLFFKSIIKGSYVYAIIFAMFI